MAESNSVAPTATPECAALCLQIVKDISATEQRNQLMGECLVRVCNVSPTPSPSPSPTAAPTGPLFITVSKPPNLPEKLREPGVLISTLVGAAILIAALLAFIYLIWGGLQWITSGGDKTALEAARGRIIAAIVGLVVVGAAWGIFILVQNVLGFNNVLNLR